MTCKFLRDGRCDGHIYSQSRSEESHGGQRTRSCGTRYVCSTDSTIKQVGIISSFPSLTIIICNGLKHKPGTRRENSIAPNGTRKSDLVRSFHYVILVCRARITSVNAPVWGTDANRVFIPAKIAAASARFCQPGRGGNARPCPRTSANVATYGRAIN